MDFFSALYQMGYQVKLKGVGDFKKSKMSTVWQFVCHYIIRSLSGRTGGTDNMGKQLQDTVWSIFTGNGFNYGQINWDDFLQYISKDAPKEGIIELTFARFWSLCIHDLHKDDQLKMGNHTNLFTARDLKRYNLSKDQSVFDPIRRLPMYIFESIRLTSIEVAGHIMATSDISPYQSIEISPTTKIEKG